MATTQLQMLWETGRVLSHKLTPASTSQQHAQTRQAQVTQKSK